MADDAGSNSTAPASSAPRAPLSQDEIDYLVLVAEDLRPTKVLARIAEQDKAIITTVGTLGTLLAGLGGVTAAISISQTTFYVGALPLIPVGALITSVLASVAVGVALFGSRPVFTKINVNNLYEVKDWVDAQVWRGKRSVSIASYFFIAAAIVAALTSAVAGFLTIANAQDDPRSLAALEASVGDKGAVKIQLKGLVDGLDDSEHLKVVVVGTPTDSTAGELISIEVYPDSDGKAALDAEATAPVGSTQAVAKIWVVKDGETPATYRGRDPTFRLSAQYPEVAEPATPAGSTASTP